MADHLRAGQPLSGPGSDGHTLGGTYAETPWVLSLLPAKLVPLHALWGLGGPCSRLWMMLRHGCCFCSKGPNCITGEGGLRGSGSQKCIHLLDLGPRVCFARRLTSSQQLQLLFPLKAGQNHMAVTAKPRWLWFSSRECHDLRWVHLAVLHQGSQGLLCPEFCCGCRTPRKAIQAALGNSWKNEDSLCTGT